MASTITPTSAAPTVLHTSASLAASGNTSDTLDLTNGYSPGGSWEAQLIVKAVFGTVAATAGIKIEIFGTYNNTGPVFSNTANYTYTIPATGSTTTYSPAIVIPTGKWSVKMTNLDASNAVTLENAYSLLSAVGVV